MARTGGYQRPFLHGLCTYGVVGRALLGVLCNGRPEQLEAYEARFSGIVFPGDTLTVRAWRDGGDEVLLDAQTPRGPALSGGRMRLRPAGWSPPAPG
jgi:acyl dehydratase